MRNTRKTLIISVLLAELAVGAYLVFHKGDDTADTRATQDGASQEEASDPTFGDSHVTAGSIAGNGMAGNAGTVAAMGSGGNAAIAPAQSTTSAFATPEPFAPPVQNAAPAPQPALKAASDAAPAQNAANTANTSNTSSALDATLQKHAAAVARAEASREGSRVRGSRPSTSAITDQLVRESAQLDPLLPPPPPMPAMTAPTPLVKADPSRRSNPVAAAMTDSLVRDSARLDPSLPPPKLPASQ